MTLTSEVTRPKKEPSIPTHPVSILQSAACRCLRAASADERRVAEHALRKEGERLRAQRDQLKVDQRRQFRDLLHGVRDTVTRVASGHQVVINELQLTYKHYAA